MPQYINDNTDDEFSHANFLGAYLKSRGADTAELDLLLGTHFRIATGSTKKGRLTNLTQLTIDTSFLVGIAPIALTPILVRPHLISQSRA